MKSIVEVVLRNIISREILKRFHALNASVIMCFQPFQPYVHAVFGN